VPDIEAITLSELNKLEYLELPLKKKRLNPKSIAKINAILDLDSVLNIIVVASIILVSIMENKYDRFC
tara:strand:- start:245 stop:448 length:204 start_codon:yes stop_codon:yes gene_type:complete